MIKDIFSAASGMTPRIKNQELTANNLANASTPGYKRDRLFTRELSRAELRKQTNNDPWPNPMATEAFVDHQQANFDKTGNPLDMAIDGNGFFQLQLDDGSTVLTRSGNFTIDENGLLSFPGGAIVLGEGGPIEIGAGQLTVGQTGEIEVNGLSAGRIVPVTVDDMQSLTKIGSSLYRVPEGVQLNESQNYTVNQGYLEGSNVDIVHEMIEMIVSFREYEASAKSLQSQDSTLDHLFRRVGGNG